MFLLNSAVVFFSNILLCFQTSRCGRLNVDLLAKKHGGRREVRTGTAPPPEERNIQFEDSSEILVCSKSSIDGGSEKSVVGGDVTIGKS